MKRRPSKSSNTEFAKWWARNKWKGTQWYPIYVAEDAFKAGIRFERSRKPKS